MPYRVPFSTEISTESCVTRPGFMAACFAIRRNQRALLLRTLARRRLRVRFLWSRGDAPYPADNRAVVCARCLSIAGWRNRCDSLVRGPALNACKNRCHPVAIRGSGARLRINIRRARDRNGVDLGELSSASRGPINVVRQRWIGGCIGTGGPRNSHGVLRICR